LLATSGRYSADITAGAFKPLESRRIADLLLRKVDEEGWNAAIVRDNILQAKSPKTALRLTRLLRKRLQTMGPGLWELVRDGQGLVSIHANLAAAVKHSPLFGDFLYLVVGEHYRSFSTHLSFHAWDDYLADCRGRDAAMPDWNESTKIRLRSSVFQMLALAGYIENTRTLKLQTVTISEPVLLYLKACHENDVLRSLLVSP
jgi:hypothetical protein